MLASTEGLSAPRMILLVEDDADVRSSVSELLTEHGYHVVHAENGAGAFEAMGRLGKLPDLVLLDLMMPVMNGWETMEVLKEDAHMAQIPIIVVTAHQNARVPEADAILTKPFDGYRLLDLVREHCD